VSSTISRDAIADVYPRFRPYIRRTLTIDLETRELTPAPVRLTLKLEYQQHSGSFKARGVFANMLLRKPEPAPGVVAALAALVSGACAPHEGERVGVVLSGGNTTAVSL
jgi:threonine dehydratase